MSGNVMPYDQHIRDAEGQSARCAVITLSDTRTGSTDKSGQLIRHLLAEAGHMLVHQQILPDDPAALESLLGGLLQRDDVNVILTNGGTGISRRDQTIEVIERLLDRTLPGFGEFFRMLSWEQIGSGAMLSRAAGGVAGNRLLLAMPGSTAAVELAMKRLILPELKHMLREIAK